MGDPVCAAGSIPGAEEGFQALALFGVKSVVLEKG